MNTYLISEAELYLFREGTYYRCQDKLGAHPAEENGKTGYVFSVWAPEVASVQVVGSFNAWRENEYCMSHIGGGIWSIFIPGITEGVQYKYLIISDTGERIFKADPYGFRHEVRPGTASETCDISGFRWRDGKWMKARKKEYHFSKPQNIYEVHLGSWRTHEDGSFYTYRELAKTLPAYVKDMGYTHVEFMPVTEHPFDGSWGYQVTGYFAPTSRYGSPKDFMYLINSLHQAGIGVILDWVPGHFCRDAHGLGRFNGHMLYELYDHQQWGTYIFDFGRPEVRSFLISSALFWIEAYHIDGIRVDGVTSMLYLNFSVENPAEKRYNENGTEENLNAIRFLKQLNTAIGKYFPDIFTVAEESSAWPLVTYPTDKGGLGFHYKWDMGWMNDTLRYVSTPHWNRKNHHNLLTFSMMYAFSENFVMPLSHDEVVHGKKSLIGRMPGSYDQQFSGMRLLYMYQLCHPGKKLNFMGNEIAQFIEWRYYEQLEWFLLKYDLHERYCSYIKTMNALYLENSPLWSNDRSWNGFGWIDANNSEQNILSFYRKDSTGIIVVVLNFSDRYYPEYSVGVPVSGRYTELASTDDLKFGGHGATNTGIPVYSFPIPLHGFENSIKLQIPPLGGLMLRAEYVPQL